MKLRTTIILTALIPVLITSILGCSEEQTHQEKDMSLSSPISVQVVQVRKEKAINQVEVVGTVRPVQQAEISSKITGNIINFPVKLGTRVTKGDLLVELSAEEISAQVQQAKAQLDQALRNLKRQEKLLKRKAVSDESVKSLLDQVKIADATHRESRTMLNYTKMIAPFTGIITKKIGNSGDLATPGKPLLNMEEENNLEVVTDIPEAIIHNISAGDILTISIPSAGKKVKGSVTEVSPTADPSSRTGAIKIRLPKDSLFRSGQFARVSLDVADSTTLIIPKSALTSYGQLEKVFTVDNNKARLKLVRSGEHYTDTIEILSGLTEKDSVILTDGIKLQNGQLIQPK